MVIKGKMPYGLEEQDLQVDPASFHAFERGDIEPGSLIADLVDWSPAEIGNVLECAFRLVQARGQEWVDAVEGRHIQDFICIALDTAMIWDRG